METHQKEINIFKIIIGIIFIIFGLAGFGSIASGQHPSPISGGVVYSIFFAWGILLIVFKYKRQSIIKGIRQLILFKPNSNPFISITKSFDLRTEQSNFLAAIKAKWGHGIEFFAGDAFNMISEEYLNWFVEEAKKKKMYCINHRETATLELLEAFRIQGLLTKRVDADNYWYYLLRSKSPITEYSNSKICKAYKNGRCISQQTGADTGPCSWKPSDWQNCGVVVENKLFYGKW
jgi:hypothetical protein